MNLIFELGERDLPAGHALLYFRDGDGAILATSISVPPIAFDISAYVPGFMAGMMQGMEMDNAMTATPLPPIPEQVESLGWLQALAERRRDDLVFAGGTMSGDPMRLAAETVEAARLYGELYEASTPAGAAPKEVAAHEEERLRLVALGEEGQLRELSNLTGRLRDSLRNGIPDQEVQDQMKLLADILPAKYRVMGLLKAALQTGEQGQRLAELHLERSYKLFHEDYLDLERIDREIQSISE